MASMKSRLDAARAQVIVIGFEPAEHLAVLRDRIQSPFRFVVDRNRVFYRAFDLPRIGVARTYLHPKVLGFYGKMATKGRLPQLRRNQDRRQLGGDFVLDAKGAVVLSHPERGPEDRAPVISIVRAVEKIG